MALDTPIDSPPHARRLLLVDFDWEDADLMPRLLHLPDAAVRLVAGTCVDEAGMRLAELCGIPRTADIADVTREIFDLALVSERSARRTQIEGLLLALGTPSMSPQAFLDGASGPDAPAVEAPMALHAAALEDALGGADFDTIVEQALPDLDGPTAPLPVPQPAQQRWQLGDLKHFPSPEDRGRLESALRDVMQVTGAGSAELHVVTGQGMERVVSVGVADALLSGLVGLAAELDTPQVVSGIAGVTAGRTWGAWPFATTQRRGVIAAAGMPAIADWSAWERIVEELRETWEAQDRAQAAPAFPMLPEIHKEWLTPDALRARLELALERHRRDGLRFSLHRLQFAPAPEAMTTLGEQLPGLLRDTDCLCRPAPGQVLLLTAVPRAHFPQLRRRILALWKDAWLGAELERPIPGIREERIEMTTPGQAESFMVRAAEWLSGT
jgi:hypothetical protein